MTPSPSSRSAARSSSVSEVASGWARPADAPFPADLEAIAIEAANEGAAVVRAAAGDLGTIRTKSTPTDPVTSLDLASERSIRAVLARRTPDATVLGEEDGVVTGSSDIGWVIDPIDGTVNLTYDLPIMSVSIAATRGGQVVAGAVVDVLQGDVFSAIRGGGARRVGSPIRVSEAAEMGRSWSAPASPIQPQGAPRRQPTCNGSSRPRAISAASAPLR